MNFYIFDFLIFSVLALGAFFSPRDKSNVLFIFSYSFLMFIIGIHISNNILMISRDAVLYVDWFSRINGMSLISIIEDGKDVFFQFFVKLLQSFSSSFSFIFFIFFSLIVFFKYKFSSLVVDKRDAIFFIFIWILYGQTFILYEITQIRVGLALTLISYGILLSFKRKLNFSYKVIFFIFPLFLHASTFLLLFTFIVVRYFNKIILRKSFLISLLFFSFIFKILFIDFFSNFIESKLGNAFRINSYLDGTYQDINKASLFSFLFLIKILFIIISLNFWNKISEIDKYFLVFSSISCSLYMLLSFNSVFALRISELFILFSLATFLIPLKQKYSSIYVNYILFIFLTMLGFIFCYSSHKILLG